MSFFSKFKSAPQMAASAPSGQRAYIIGDIHGCLDALLNLLQKLEAYDAQQEKANSSLIFLGDLIDRGPQSREVVEFLSTYSPSFAKPIFLMGNHEEIFLSILNGNADRIPSWFEFGGRACARSYGVENLGQVNIDPTPLQHQLRRKVPKRHIDFLSSFANYHVFGDYLCVHAGIKPKVKLENQTSQDFRWIRTPFLNYTKPHPYVIVHGHTIVDEPTHFGNRIAIDTGAYKTPEHGGKLTVLCLDGTTTRFISTP